MTASLTHARAFDPVPPPMPRRQSCDRCHEQKVRCVTEGADGALTLGGIAEENASSLSGHVVSSVPCVRCRKAGAVCIYSPQLRSGRPRLRRDSSAPPPRKKPRQVSRCSSSSSLSSTWSQSTFSPSSVSRPSTAATFSSAGIGLGILEHPNEPVHEHNAPPIQPLFSPPATAPLCELASQHGSTLEGPPPPSGQWLMSPFSSGSNHQFQSGMCQLASFSETLPDPTIPCGPLYPSSDPQGSSPAEKLIGNHPWVCPSPPSPPDYSLGELAQISLRVHLASRVLASSARTLATLSSPAVNDVVEAACSLVNFVDRYAQKRPAPLSPPPVEGGMPVHGSIERPAMTGFDSPYPGVCSVTDQALDSSIRLMIHSCHQAILGVFEEMTVSSLLLLAEPQQPTPPRTPPHAGAFQPYNTQIMVMMNQISNLLSQLDRAILSLSGTPNAHQSQRHNSVPLTTAMFRQSTPTEYGLPRDIDGHFEPPPDALRQREHGAWRQTATGSLFTEMEQRQLRVRSQVKAVESLLMRQSHVIV
ncbi:uncharacterized protein B0T15DRAFT_60584 [Chaetomium strumarium]|uniref:Zn(2)-C6 fungal-type domain-containing protein n=1 Tax=Chaetomium strumarium TaxID=1170767 RepID=A0AAJ0M6X8_9PEZI|nr:hypothetical protein B0T15DRAFT_60584 [Chaetomium strumarium]